jgi:hypothetical protein
LRPSDPRGGHALLVADVSGVRADLGAGYAAPAVRNLEQLKLSVMFSVTAPGSELYPFDPTFCSHPPGETCSGKRGCRVNPEVAKAFNAHAGKWWSELHRAAKVRADRATGFKGKIAARVWEKQKRGWRICTA